MDEQLSRRAAPQAVGTMQDRIRLALEAEILMGKRAPGSSIDEKALAATFKSSRTPVREALLILATQGLIQIAPRSGIFVRRATAGELISTLETLSELEAALARLAAKRATSRDHDDMKKALDIAGPKAKKGDPKIYRQANADLHEIIYRASGNPVLVEHTRSVRSALAAYRQRVFDQPGRIAGSHAEHAIIVAAICAGNEREAETAMRNHINRGGEAMASLVLAAEQITTS